ncbi:MAG TPA: type II toxin-antitoxin system VapC family toxin [Pirellulales bacterium]|nr:type II toxin-antitoxin system VapC family toxin [Pirellulales bacterium]
MTIYLLDTNAWIEVLRDRNQGVVEQVASKQRDEIRLCSVVKAELYFGAFKKSGRAGNLGLLQDLFTKFNSLPFDDAAAEACGKLRAELNAKGTPIGPYDLMIAAIALVNGATLVTHNISEFSRVDGLSIEDWQED